jgi:stress-induced morphogen
MSAPDTQVAMDPSDVADLIREALPDARVRVRRARGKHDDDHLAALVVSPAFEGETLVDQHELVYDALESHMTTDIHALELKTYAPDAFEDADVAFEEA